MKKWFGANDSKTSMAYFGFTDGREHQTMYVEEFTAVKNKLLELKKIGAVDISYIDDEGYVHNVIAYRFVSDRAYNRHMYDLISLGGGLGRGVWCPFHDKYLYDMFLGN